MATAGRKAHSLAARSMIAIALLGSVSACAGLHPGGGHETVTLTKAQECAVGYDLARDIYQQAEVDGTVVHVPKHPGGCGTYAITYLRRAGFEVVNDGPGRDAFKLETWAQPSADGFVATAHLPGLTVTRAYRPAYGGVYALSPASVVKSDQG